jgi:hypothetical protein
MCSLSFVTRHFSLFAVFVGASVVAKLLKHFLILLISLLCLAVTSILPAGTMEVSDLSGNQTASLYQEREARLAPPPPFAPVYRIPLRVHLHKSGRTLSQFSEILEEINQIWWSQAGICFEMHTVDHDMPLEQGLDLWFLPAIGGNEVWNGLYRSDHDMQVRDTPLLAAARNPARHPAARTAAHELGHALDLDHRQDSDDNLMRSKTFGWRLSKDEILTARRTAALKAQSDTGPLGCGVPAGSGE